MTKPEEVRAIASDDEPVVVNFDCPDCGEQLRGLEGTVARCPYCGGFQDAPYRDDIAATQG